jgi:hypothetical protein
MTPKELDKIEKKYREFEGIMSADIILKLCKEIRELWKDRESATD